MRCTQPVQIQLGEVDINSVEFDLQSRDDIPVYCDLLNHTATGVENSPLQ